MNKIIVIVAVCLVIFIPLFVIFAPKDSSNNNNTAKQTEKCIVTVDGNKYDLTEFRKIHEGGDIFECGTDMSTTFHGQHGEDIARLAPYLVK